MHHADPYTSVATECGNAIQPGAGILRAPHPPFALGIYALMALFPFKSVGIAYIVFAWLAVGATAIAISRITRIEAWIVALGIAPLLGYFCISLGQPQPFVALCIVLCARSLAAARFDAAAICAALTLVFPQVGLPTIATLFFCAPKSRRTLIVAVVSLALIGLAILGPSANVHYVTVSLKLEQLQTAGDSLQYGVPWLLQQFAVPPPAAAFVGSLWYVGTLVGSIVLLRRYVTATTLPIVALVPPALVTLTSTFVHPQHFALALPLAFFVLSTNRSDRGPILVGTALLVVPWMDCIVATMTMHDLGRVTILFALGLAFVASFASSRKGLQQRRSIAIVLVAVAVLYVCCALIVHGLLGGIASVDTPPNGLATLSFKLPTIAGLLTILAYGLVAPIRRATSTAAYRLSPR